MLHLGGKVTPLVMALLGVVCLVVQDLGAERRTIVMGGADGLAWADGGGAIAATVNYWSTLAMDRWTPTALKPVSISMATT